MKVISAKFFISQWPNGKSQKLFGRTMVPPWNQCHFPLDHGPIVKILGLSVCRPSGNGINYKNNRRHRLNLEDKASLRTWSLYLLLHFVAFVRSRWKIVRSFFWAGHHFLVIMNSVWPFEKKKKKTKRIFQHLPLAHQKKNHTERWPWSESELTYSLYSGNRQEGMLENV